MVQEIENIINILEKARKALKQEDTILIKNLSNRTVHSSSIDQDPDNINIAVILYTLSKLLERTRYKEMPGWGKFEKTYIDSIDNALIALKRKDIPAYRSQINRITQEIELISGHLKDYIQDVFRKAQISKASRIYEHGISRENAAKILDVSLWELNQYVGQTGISEVSITYTWDIKQRLKFTQEMFK